jgi:glucokinase
MGRKSSMLLAGDIGGTKTLLGLFEATTARPRAVSVHTFTTLDYPALSAIVDEFIRSGPVEHAAIDRACFGVAGPVISGTATLTNVPWKVEARALADEFRLQRVDLLNDLQAMAYGVPVLTESEVHVLQKGEAVPDGNIGLIAAGTGLGVAMLHWVGGQFIPAASEGGHADFAARNEREIELLRWLVARNGRADVENVVSGRGILNLHRVAHAERCLAVTDLDDHDAAAAITAAALEHRCRGCVETLDMFVDAYGAEAGNLALRTLSTGGVFVGGGIAPKVLPAITDGRFMRSFRSKSPYEALLSAMPVKVILNDETGLVGAAVYASRS